MTRNPRLLAARVIPTAFTSCARPFMWVVPIFGIDPLSGRCGSVLRARSRSASALAGILVGTSPCDSITPEEVKERAVNNFPFCLQYVIKPVVKSAASRRNAWTRMHRKSSG
jgi:hypothetical protein